MPNKNYNRGRRLEYAFKRQLDADGYTTMRTAGSHGPFDLVALKEHEAPILIQCKATKDEAAAQRLSTKFRQEPPLPISFRYRQWLVVKVPRQTTKVVEVG